MAIAMLLQRHSLQTDQLLLSETAPPMDPWNILATAWMLGMAEAIRTAPAKEIRSKQQQWQSTHSCKGS